jgi:hypothetical protein
VAGFCFGIRSGHPPPPRSDHLTNRAGDWEKEVRRGARREGLAHKRNPEGKGAGRLFRLMRELHKDAQPPQTGILPPLDDGINTPSCVLRERWMPTKQRRKTLMRKIGIIAVLSLLLIAVSAAVAAAASVHF